MPAYAVRVTGGRKLRRFVVQARGVSGSTLARRFVQLFPIEQLRSAAPRRTGRLADSLHVVAVRGTVELRGVFYAAFDPNKGPIVAKFFELAATTNRLVIRSVLP